MVDWVGLVEWCAGHYTDFEPLIILITLISLIFLSELEFGGIKELDRMPGKFNKFSKFLKIRV
ncbi:hypothetical protein HYN43_029915 [Mucilaginibacter celer]|uniref:Uncharacterized protein n=1 Tax=Mucilaginibacter celer TaxID=2305508 RepID=A0A494VUF9_9SPHI|nr:hypothetical protein HYN43_029915 [Mucilaginibacter celer]